MELDGHEIVLFPFLAQGHIIPFIALANLIEQQTKHTITLVTTPLNILKIKPLLHPTTSIHLTQLPFSASDHGLSSDVENTDTVPFHLLLPFFLATESLRPSFDLLLSEIVHRRGRENVTVIADVFLGWAVESAEKLGVFHSVFVTSGAYGCAMFFSLWLHPPTFSEHSSDDDVDDDELLPLPDYPEIQITRLELYNTMIPANGLENSLNGFMTRQISHCCHSGGLLVNTAEEFEKAGLNLLRRSPGLPVWAIGPVTHPDNSTDVAGDSKTIIKYWLDSKPLASVVYVSFGSQSSIPTSQMMELAMGLEASGAPFIWVVRPPVEFAPSSEFRPDEWLPDGFEDRMRESNQGLIVRRWAPQREILSHASTGAFLSHCGWNSVIESLERGVPIIGWPIISDQLYNCKMMVEMGVCVEVRSWRMEEVRRVVVVRAIGQVTGETEGSWEMRKRVEGVRKMLRAALVVEEDGSCGGHSLRNLQDFFNGRKNMKA